VIIAIPYGYFAVRAGLWQGIIVNALNVLLLADLFFAYRVLKRGFIQRAAYTLLPCLMLVISANALITDAVPAAAPTLLALVVVAGIVLGSQGNLAMAALAFVMWLATFLIDRMGVIPPSPIPPIASTAIFVALTAASFFFIAVVGYDASRRLQTALSDANYQLVESNVKLERSQPP